MLIAGQHCLFCPLFFSCLIFIHLYIFVVEKMYGIPVVVKHKRSPPKLRCRVEGTHVKEGGTKWITIFFFHRLFSEKNRNKTEPRRYNKVLSVSVQCRVYSNKKNRKKGHIKVDTFSISNPYLNDNSWEMCLVNGQHLEGRIEPDKEGKKKRRRLWKLKRMEMWLERSDNFVRMIKFFNEVGLNKKDDGHQTRLP